MSKKSFGGNDFHNISEILGAYFSLDPRTREEVRLLVMGMGDSKSPKADGTNAEKKIASLLWSAQNTKPGLTISREDRLTPEIAEIRANGQGRGSIRSNAGTADGRAPNDAGPIGRKDRHWAISPFRCFQTEMPAPTSDARQTRRGSGRTGRRTVAWFQHRLAIRYPMIEIYSLLRN